MKPHLYRLGNETRVAQTNGERYAVLGMYGVISTHNDRQEAIDACAQASTWYTRFPNFAPKVYRLCKTR